VNLFRGRTADDLQKAGAIEGDGAGIANVGVNGKATAYVRPHDVEVSRHINGTPGLLAEVISTSATGPTARVYLKLSETKELVEAEMTRERHRELALATGETVHVSWRKARIFTDDYSI
jgi:sulfate transport system ATP-binding protein